MRNSLFCISPLGRNFNRLAFDSGSNELDRFLKNFALKNQESSIGKTWVLHRKGSDIILGYYTICTASITVSILPDQVSSKLPQYPVPCVLLARLAVDKGYRDNGYGKRLLKDAIDKTITVSQIAGAFALIVDAKDQNAVSFYEHFGFLHLIGQKNKLFIPVKTVTQKDRNPIV